MSTANDAGFSKAKVLADDVARAVDTVNSDGAGQYIVLQFPNDFNYTVIVDTSGVSVTYNNNVNQKAQSSIIPSNDLKNSPVMTPGDKWNISNEQGKIKFVNITT